MEFVWEALKDSLIILPFLFISYVLIEVIEFFSANKLEHSRLLSGRFSTLFGAGFGLIPQCGFSVVATDLFASHKIKIGTLVAVYIATSDEAVPVMLMHPNKALSLVALLAIKFVVAVVVGYAIELIFKKVNQKHLLVSFTVDEGAKNKDSSAEQEVEPIEENVKNEETAALSAPAETASEKEHHHEHEEVHDESHHTGCCGHDINTSTRGAKAKIFILHPLIHTLKIFAFILIVNLALGGLVELVTEERLAAFLQSSMAFAPLLACLIGLIPNCAGSVVITELFVSGGLSFGATVAGLIVNAGIALVVLFRRNKNLKQNFAILGGLLLVGLVVGYAIQLLGF